jgi:hypothetical protein
MARLVPALLINEELWTPSALLCGFFLRDWPTGRVDFPGEDSALLTGKTPRRQFGRGVALSALRIVTRRFHVHHHPSPAVRVSRVSLVEDGERCATAQPCVPLVSEVSGGLWMVTPVSRGSSAVVRVERDPRAGSLRAVESDWELAAPSARGAVSASVVVDHAFACPPERPALAADWALHWREVRRCLYKQGAPSCRRLSLYYEEAHDTDPLRAWPALHHGR